MDQVEIDEAYSTTNATLDADEALARYLYQQEKLEMEDRQFALQLQNQDLKKQLEMTPSSSKSPDPTPNYNADLALAKRLQFEYESDYALAKKLQQEHDSDYALAHKLQHEHESDYALAKQLENTVDESILDDTIPNLHLMFQLFNRKYFNNQLDMVEVKWSHKMTRCAGTCAFRDGNHCIVTLSEPLLKFRSKKDMIETLLHEMIHALLFVTQRNTDRDGHGPEFLREAKRISQAANVNITVFHDFHDEVRHYQTHVWKCDGPCQHRAPYFGTVKRAMNRPPQKADSWFGEHQLTCGGTFHKVASPLPKEKPAANSKKRKKQPEEDKINNTLDKYFKEAADDFEKKLKEM